MVKLPCYRMVIDEDPASDVEVSFVALVDKPAIEKNFMAFNSLKMDFAADTERQIISGPAMVANTLIYRRDDSGEYNVYFDKETIASIALKFFKKDYQKNLNLFHDPSLSLEGVTIFESFISDSTRGIKPMAGYEDLPDGTWFISAKVENPDVWAKIKSGAVKGFSVEGIFSYVKKPLEMEQQIVQILNATYGSSVHLSETTIMQKVKDMLANLKKSLFEGTPMPPAPAPVPPPPPAPAPTTDYTLKDGTAVSINTLGVGGVVLIAGAPAPAGEYELIDGTKVTVADGGTISVVTPSTAVPPPPAPAPPVQMEAAQEALSKFAIGDSDKLANIELVTRFLMENVCGWDIRRAEDEANKAKAIEIYKTGFEEHKKATDIELMEAKKVIAEQDKKIVGLFAIIEEMAAIPTVEEVGGEPAKFRKSEKAQSKEEARQRFITAFKKNKN